MLNDDINCIKVLQVLGAPREDPSGGWAAYMRRIDMLAEGLRVRGCQVDCVHVPELNAPKRPTLAKLLASKQLRQLAANYDVIHAANALAGAIAALGVRGMGVKLIYDVHGDSSSENWLNWRLNRKNSYISQALQMRIFDRIALRKADGFLVVSKPSYDFYVRRGVSPEKLIITRNGADMDVFKKLPFRGNDGILRVCYTGGFQGWQGIDNLVRACKLLHQRGWPDKLRLCVVGFRPENVHIRDELMMMLGDKFEPVDRVPFEEVPKLLAAADMMIIPRLPHFAVRVAMPTKFGEYLAGGRPVIVTDVDETAVLVRKNGCGIVAEANAESLADAMEQAAALPYETVVEMGAKARDLAEREFCWDSIAGDYYQFLKKILGRT